MQQGRTFASRKLRLGRENYFGFKLESRKHLVAKENLKVTKHEENCLEMLGSFKHVERFWHLRNIGVCIRGANKYVGALLQSTQQLNFFLIMFILDQNTFFSFYY